MAKGRVVKIRVPSGDDALCGRWTYFCRMELSQDAKNILGLQLPTDPRWTDLAGKSLEEILTDHAYCEQKAASSCISIIQRYSEKEMLVNELAPVVTEEWG